MSGILRIGVLLCFGASFYVSHLHLSFSHSLYLSLSLSCFFCVKEREGESLHVFARVSVCAYLSVRARPCVCVVLITDGCLCPALFGEDFKISVNSTLGILISCAG